MSVVEDEKPKTATEENEPKTNDHGAHGLIDDREWRHKRQERHHRYNSHDEHAGPKHSLVTKFGTVDVPSDIEIAERNGLMLHMLYDRLVTSDSVVVLILCGIPGCGKTTFAKKLCAVLPPSSRWESFNQDALGSRTAVEHHSSVALGRRHSVIIDRCNFDRSQRKTWIRLADQFQADCVICLVMENYLNFELCSDRAFKRGDDGVHDGDTDWSSVCSSMAKQFQYPVIQEGFSGIYHCRDSADTDLFIGAFSDMNTEDKK
jgi:predicted kinase